MADESYYWYKSHGICVKCKKNDASPNRIMCDECREKWNAITEKHFKDQKVWDYSLWLNYAMNAYMSTYGYEWQGDNLLLARCNLFLTLMENFRSLFGNEIENHRMSPVLIDAIADVISWNVWQMDDLKKTVPGTDIPCKIKDWKADKEILFKDVGEGD